MKIKYVTDKAFKRYGRVIEGIDFTELVEVLNTKTPLTDSVEYVPSAPELEGVPVYRELVRKFGGHLPVQIGYCNGKNYLLNALEYHRSSEWNVAGTDAVLLLGALQDVTEDFTYDTSLVEAFFLPKGTAVELYATTLHYAPCSVGGEGFRVAVVLPEGTNLPLNETYRESQRRFRMTADEEPGEEGKESYRKTSEDTLLTAKNKWLIGHPEGGFPEGTHIGLIGENFFVN